MDKEVCRFCDSGNKFKKPGMSASEPENPQECVACFDSVSYSYPNGVLALDNVSFSVGKGDFLAIIGPNGAGKSTLIKLLLGLLKPSSGKIWLFGSDPSAFANRSKIAYLQQRVLSFDSLFPATVEEVVLMGLAHSKGLFKNYSYTDRQKASAVLSASGISDLASKRISELSSGQQQRVFLSRALVSQPELLVMDEPTVGVDTTSQEKFYSLLHSLNTEKGTTIIMITHDTSVISGFISKLACLNVRLHYHGEPVELDKNMLKAIYGKHKGIIDHIH